MDDITRKPTVLAVESALRAVGVTPRVRVLPETAPTAAAAAGQLGCSVAAIANSLIFDAEGTPLLVLTSGAHRVDTGKVAAHLGITELSRASAQFVRAHTGQAIGGVAPLGHPAPIRTLIDETLADQPEIWAAAGHPHTVFPTTFQELVAATGAEAISVN